MLHLHAACTHARTHTGRQAGTQARTQARTHAYSLTHKTAFPGWSLLRHLAACYYLIATCCLLLAACCLYNLIATCCVLLAACCPPVTSLHADPITFFEAAFFGSLTSSISSSSQVKYSSCSPLQFRLQTCERHSPTPHFILLNWREEATCTVYRSTPHRKTSREMRACCAVLLPSPSGVPAPLHRYA
jgi:hypothetical protein